MSKAREYLNLTLMGTVLYLIDFLICNHIDFALTPIQIIAIGTAMLIVNLGLGIAAARIAISRQVIRSNDFYLFLLATLHISSTAYRHQHGPDGDAPHYLIAVESLYQDHDLLVKNNYTSQDNVPYSYRQGGRSYIVDPNDARYTTNVRGEDQLWYSIGVVLLNAPLRIANNSLLINLVLAHLTFLGMLAIWRRRNADSWQRATIYLSSPIFAFTTQVFPDPYAFCLMAITTVSLSNWDIRNHWIVPLCCALMIWLKPPFVSLAAMMMGVWFLKVRSSSIEFRVREFRAVSLPALSAAGILIYNWVSWGKFGLTVNYPSLFSSGFSITNWPAQVPRFFFGMGGGVFWGYPLLTLAFVGVRPFAADRQLADRMLIAVALIYVLVISSFPFSEGGWCPRGRYFLVILPLFLIQIDETFQRYPRLTQALAALSLVCFFIPTVFPDAIMPLNDLGYPFSLLHVLGTENSKTAVGQTLLMFNEFMKLPWTFIVPSVIFSGVIAFQLSCSYSSYRRVKSPQYP